MVSGLSRKPNSRLPRACRCRGGVPRPAAERGIANAAVARNYDEGTIALTGDAVYVRSVTETAEGGAIIAFMVDGQSQSVDFTAEQMDDGTEISIGGLVYLFWPLTPLYDANDEPLIADYYDLGFWVVWPDVPDEDYSVDHRGAIAYGAKRRRRTFQWAPSATRGPFGANCGTPVPEHSEPQLPDARSVYRRLLRSRTAAGFGGLELAPAVGAVLFLEEATAEEAVEDLEGGRARRRSPSSARRSRHRRPRWTPRHADGEWKRGF